MGKKPLLQTLADVLPRINWFLSLEDAREKIEAWRVEYSSTLG
ncbi:hypothetical protein SAMN05421747_1323 [Parapedobacter composti]|uniref:Uncharacterized protein n=1 Tax=Parapedobacter composti TaxID=623281 RepID=A0A1I1MLZ4_9SPHI|nr:hypothetical protein SAMN05421747_1323 [Parapedobacter composti]